jgi:hypothetical protein
MFGSSAWPRAACMQVGDDPRDEQSNLDDQAVSKVYHQTAGGVRPFQAQPDQRRAGSRSFRSQANSQASVGPVPSSR